jgi:hypothetical protein
MVQELEGGEWADAVGLSHTRDCCAACFGCVHASRLQLLEVKHAGGAYEMMLW